MDNTIQIGTILGDTYEIRERIGSGGGGTIYKGYHTHLRKDVAIKKVHDKGKYDREEVFREAAILTRLKHSYLPVVYDFLYLESGVYTVMDFIPGKSLEQLLKEGHSFSEQEVIKYGKQLAEVLGYLHSQRPAIIHGDVKPANIMITPEGNVCLIDFNISGLADAQGNAYVMGVSEGYAAPEQYAEYQRIKERISKAQLEWESSNLGAGSVGQEYAINNAYYPPVQQPAYSPKPVSGTDILNPSMNATELLDPSMNATELLDPSMNGTELLDASQNIQGGFAGVGTVSVYGATGGTETIGGYNGGFTGNVNTGYTAGPSNSMQVSATLGNAGSNSQGSAYSAVGPSYQNPRPTMSSLGIKGIHIDPRSDVYSIGATLFHLLTGRKITEITSGEVTINISDGLITIINKMLEGNPNDRYGNANEVVKAFSNISKFDRKYKSARVGRQIAVIVAIMLIGLGIVLTVFGVRQKRKDKEVRYDSCVQTIMDCVAESERDEAEEAFADAVEIDPLRIDSYMAKAEYLFRIKAYVDDVDFINRDILQLEDADRQTDIDYIYYLLGRSYYELGDKDLASNAFYEAIARRADMSEYYIFNALCLADIGYVKEAEAQLKTALKLKADEAYVKLLTGEIAKREKDYDEALTNFEECLAIGSDDYVKFRAYIFSNDIYKELDVTEENLEARINMLKRAVKELPSGYSVIIQSALAESYMQLYNAFDNEEAGILAIEAYEALLKLGASEFVLYNNLTILYEKFDRYEDARELLRSCENLYSNYYAYYKRLAFLEFHIQNDRGSGMDFAAFEEYYSKADSMYKSLDSQDDAEMIYLTQTYDNYLAAVRK